MIAHITDTHLGYRQYGLVERDEDVYRLFNEVVDKILRERPDIIVHTGDLFDQPRPPTRALITAYNGFRRLVDRGIRVYGILGDYDFPRRDNTPPHRLLEELGVIRIIGSKPLQEEPYIEIRNQGSKILLAGVKNFSRKHVTILKRILGRLSEIVGKYHRSILMLHQGIREYSRIGYELELKDLPEGFNYYALGHLHIRTWFRYMSGIAGYAGSIDVMSLEEWDDYKRNGKGFYLVDLSPDIPVVHRVDLDGIRRHVVLETSYSLLEEELRKISQQLEGEKLKPILYLIVKGGHIDKARVYRLLLKIIQDKVLSWRLRFKEEPGRKTSVPGGLDKIDLRELVRRSLSNEREAELAYQLLELLGKGDTSAALELTKKYYEEEWW